MASCTLCDSSMELDDGHDHCISCLGPEHLKQDFSDPCPSCSCLPLAIRESRLARWNAQFDYSLLSIDTTLSERGVKRASWTVVPPPKKKKVKTSSVLERRVDQLTEGMGQIQPFLASMKKNNEEQRLAESNTVDSGRERDFDVVSVSASDSYFDEHSVMTETVGSPVSLRSSSALSPGHDGEPVSVANSLHDKLKVALAKLNLDAPPSETNQAPNLFCRSSGQANELVVPQCGEFIKELSFGFKSALTMRPDKVKRMLSSMADAGSVGLDSMPPVETVVASLAVQADEVLRSEPRCTQPEYKRTDTLVHKTYSAVANVGCINKYAGTVTVGTQCFTTFIGQFRVC